jgi:hypothetical protein
MAKFTFIELHVDDASFSADRPFSNLVSRDEDEPADDPDADTAADLPDTPSWKQDEETGGRDVPTRGLATVGVLVALVGLAAAVRRLAGGDQPEVDIETPEDDDRPVGVTVDE